MISPRMSLATKFGTPPSPVTESTNALLFMPSMIAGAIKSSRTKRMSEYHFDKCCCASKAKHFALNISPRPVIPRRRASRNSVLISNGGIAWLSVNVGNGTALLSGCAAQRAANPQLQTMKTPREQIDYCAFHAFRFSTQISTLYL